MLYQLYRTVFKSIEYIRIDNHLQIEKLTFLYHLESDAFNIILPSTTEDLYKKYISYKKKSSSEKEINQNRETHQKKTIKDTKQIEKEKKELENDIEKLNAFVPTIEQDEKKIIISWITQRSLFHKELFSKVSYIFEKTTLTHEGNPIYKAYRKETPLTSSYELAETGKKYTIISFMTKPEIFFVKQDYKEEDNEKKIDKNDLKKAKKPSRGNLFSEWKKKKLFETKKNTEKITIDNLLAETIMPQSMIISGEILSENKKKRNYYRFTINFPPSDYAFNLFLSEKDNPETQKDITPTSVPQSSFSPLPTNKGNEKNA